MTKTEPANHYVTPTRRLGVNTVDRLKQAARRLSAACDEAISALEASGHVAHATNPLDYAWAHHEQYIEQWGGLGATTLLLGMNPGPWGMAQSGVPFGATEVAKDFLKITPCDLETPANAHPNRPILGLDLDRQEVSGTRLWNLLDEMFGTPEATFANPDRRAWIESKIKLGRVGALEDIMGPCLFLASDASALVTGTALLVDGGWTAD